MNTTISLEKAAADRLHSRTLLSRVRDDPNAFFLFWPSCQPELYRACLKWMGNQQDAEDVLSEIALKVWGLLPKHAENITDLKGWLTRLSYHHCMDVQRRCQRESKHQMGLRAMIETDKEIVSNGLLPQEFVLNDEMFNYLSRAVTRLPERLREVVILRFWQDKSYQQIADQIGVSSSAVGKRLQEARSALRNCLRSF